MEPGLGDEESGFAPGYGFAVPNRARDLLRAGDYDGLLDAAAINQIYTSKTERQSLLDQVSRAWGQTIRDGFGQTETTVQIANPPVSVTLGDDLLALLGFEERKLIGFFFFIRAGGDDALLL